MSGGQLIAVDIGNSFAKLGWFAAGAEIAKELPLPSQTADFPTDKGPHNDLLHKLPQEAVRWRVASVNRAGQKRLGEWVRQHRPADDYQLLTHPDLPIEVQVDEPLKVGLDRLAAAVAANVLRSPNTPAIVVGAGTAVTVNLIGADGVFLGGTIFAGFRMSAEALFGAADLLPLATLLPNEEPPAVVGKNTDDAIRSGLFWGAVGAVREIVTRMKAELGTEPDLFITGGDLRRLSPLVAQHARYLPHLVLSGLAIAAEQTGSA